MRPIHLLPLGALPPGLTEHLVATLAPRFRVPVVVDPPTEARPDWRDDARAQYRADAILAALVADPPADGGRRIALLPADLFAPGLAFTLGLATLAGCCAVVALARLDPAFHGEPPDAGRFFRRAAIETLHELGHTLGLAHCADPACVMHYSRSIADTDRKTLDFCAACAR
ncbi:MAG: peptidase zinc-dependent [Gemmatimonadetes bacterium]|nr:peptidase zinc-dependent [Gemmatimonadota bacterium]